MSTDAADTVVTQSITVHAPIERAFEVFTRDFGKAQRAIDEILAGYTWVNSIQVAYDELPFGGWKHSGYGKEHGTDVLDYYTEEKSVILAGV